MRMFTDIHPYRKSSGFTMIELMISLAIFLVAMTSIYQLYHSQQNAYVRQDMVSELQQQMRAAVFFLNRDIQWAGAARFDLEEHDRVTSDADINVLDGDVKLGFGDISASGYVTDNHEMVFTADRNFDGNFDNTIGEDDVGEIVRFALNNDDDGDGISDGINTSGSWKETGEDCSLGREYIAYTGGTILGSGLQPIADHVQAVEFCYVLTNGNQTLDPGVGDFENICGVIISLLLRTSNRSRNYHNNETYVPASADPQMTPDLVQDRPALWGPFDDNFIRRFEIIQAWCPNMGRDRP